MLESIIATVIGGLVLTGILALPRGVRWLRKRRQLRDWKREHDVPPVGPIGLSGYVDEHDDDHER
jgi:hypothetical protein